MVRPASHFMTIRSRNEVISPCLVRGRPCPSDDLWLGPELLALQLRPRGDVAWKAAGAQRRIRTGFKVCIPRPRACRLFHQIGARVTLGAWPPLSCAPIAMNARLQRVNLGRFARSRYHTNIQMVPRHRGQIVSTCAADARKRGQWGKR